MSQLCLCSLHHVRVSLVRLVLIHYGDHNGSSPPLMLSTSVLFAIYLQVRSKPVSGVWEYLAVAIVNGHITAANACQPAGCLALCRCHFWRQLQLVGQGQDDRARQSISLQYVRRRRLAAREIVRRSAGTRAYARIRAAAVPQWG